MKRTCLECGDSLLGRADKKFCGDTCRNAYHNAANRVSNNLIRTTHNRLKKNHRILVQLVSQGNTKVARETLLQLGFSFDVITEIQFSQNNTLYRFVYDQGYVALENGSYLIAPRSTVISNYSLSV